MKFYPGVSTTAVSVILCVISLLSQTVHATNQKRVMFSETMTPTWLEAHASFIDDSHTTTAEQVTFHAGSLANHTALLKVPIKFPSDCLQYSTHPLTVRIVVNHDASIGSLHDSDISYGVSDGTNFIGFKTFDELDSRFPFLGHEGTSGTTLTGGTEIGPTSKPDDTHYPGQYLMILRLDEPWGSCYTAHDGGFVKAVAYKKRLMLNKGLTFEVYKENNNDSVGIKYIVFSLIQNS